MDQVEDTYTREEVRQKKPTCSPILASWTVCRGNYGDAKGRRDTVGTLVVVSQTLLTKEKAWLATWFGSRDPELEELGL